MSYVFTILGSRPQTIFVTDKYCPQKSSKTTMTKIGNRNIAIDIQLEDIAIVLPNIVRRTNLVKMTDKYCQGKLYSRFLPNLVCVCCVCVCVVDVCISPTCFFPQCIFPNSIFPKCIYPKCIFAQYTQLALRVYSMSTFMEVAFVVTMVTYVRPFPLRFSHASLNCLLQIMWMDTTCIYWSFICFLRAFAQRDVC